MTGDTQQLLLEASRSLESRSHGLAPNYVLLCLFQRSLFLVLNGVASGNSGVSMLQGKERKEI